MLVPGEMLREMGSFLRRSRVAPSLIGESALT